MDEATRENIEQLVLAINSLHSAVNQIVRDCCNYNPEHSVPRLLRDTDRRLAWTLARVVGVATTQAIADGADAPVSPSVAANQSPDEVERILKEAAKAPAVLDSEGRTLFQVGGAS